MKRIAFLGLVLAALSGVADTLLYQDANGPIVKYVEGVAYRFGQYTTDEVALYADSAWWYTPDAFDAFSVDVAIKDTLGKIDTGITVTDKSTVKSITDDITAKVPESAQGAYAVSVAALAYAMYNSVQTDILKQQMKTVGQSLQSQLLMNEGIGYGEFTDDNGVTYKFIDSKKSPDINNVIEGLKKGRAAFTPKKDGNVTIAESKFVYDAGLKLIGGEGGTAKSDGMSITNLETYADASGKIHTNVLAIAGWWGTKGRDKPDAENICDFTLEDFGKDPDKRDSNFNKHYLLTRTSGGEVHYLSMSNAVKAVVKVDECSINTNEAGQVALHSFTNDTRNAQMSLGDIMVADKEEEPHLYNWQTNAYVVTKTRENDGSFQLWYIPVGALKGNTPDKKSIDISLIGTTSNKLEIAGFAAATNKASETAVGDAFADKMFSSSASEILLPVKAGDKISWLALGNYDINEKASGLEANAVSNAQGMVERQFQLANWSSVTNFMSTYKSGAETLADIQWGDEEITTASSNLCVLVKDLQTGELHYVAMGQSAADKESMEYAKTWIRTATGELEEIKALQLAHWSSMTNMEASFMQGINSMADYMLNPEVDADATTNMLFIAKDLTDGEMKYVPFGSIPIDAESLGVFVSKDEVTGAVKKSLELEGWSTITNAAMTAYTSIADLMTGTEEEKAEIATNLAVLAKNLKTSKLEYILLGNMVAGTDNQSVTMTNKLDAATGKSNSVYTVYGFLDAASGKVPMKVGEGDEAKIVWTNITATASNNVDNLTIQLWRKDGETNDVHMVKGFADKDAEEKGLDTLLGDTKDTSEDSFKYQVLARKLEKTKTLDNSTNGLELVYLDIKDGLLGTNKWKKATSSGNRSDSRSYFDPNATNLTSGTEAIQGVALEAGRMLDGSSVSTNGNLRGEILGFSGADLYTVPMKGAEQDPYSPSPARKVEWKPLAFADSEASSFGVSGRPTTLNAQLVNSADADGSYKELSLYGFENAKTHAMPFKYNNGNGGTFLQWVDPPEGVLGNPAKVLTYNGAEIAWDDASGGAPVDDASITTNTEHGATSSGVASIYGFNDATENQIPHKSANGKIEWKEVSQGGAFHAKGNATSTSYLVTNVLSFASSDTTYTASNEGSGSVKITSNLNGITGASAGKAPFKSSSGNSLTWEYPVYVNGYGPVRRLNFQSGQDSNVHITTSVSGDTATIKIDVYWK